MTKTIEYTERLVVVTCWCGMNHAVPEALRNFQERRHDDGEEAVTIYCPLGHGHSPAREAKAKRLQRQLDEQRDLAARFAAERDQAEASARAHKAAATRARKRSAAGVCPCCHRSFKQLRRHMTSKHPDYDPSAE